jgi:hypothetical protein
VQERLLSQNIDEYKEVQINNSDDAGILLDDDTERKFLMSEDGYGRSTASGIDEDGDQSMISTIDSEQDVQEILPTQVDDPVAILELVIEKLRTIINRTLQ